MAVQDDQRETEAIQRFNLTQADDRKRADIDAYLDIDGLLLPFELKSSTSGNVSTVRDFGPDHIRKWRDGLHWIFAFYNKDGSKLLHCYYASPRDMEEWIEGKEAYIKSDAYLADTVPAFVTPEMVIEILGEKEVYSLLDAFRIMKRQWSSQQYQDHADVVVDPAFPKVTASGRPKKNHGGYSLARMTEILQQRCEYVIRRGATLNNPHIEASYFERFEKITSDHAATLRRLVRDYLAKTDEIEEATA
ncbi:hypothetical protein [Arthrobacter sp. AZCC_0090]|uniref:hypothetical protein n=1 Tax=Arthrobacter sp. AZCC_0090 TaxID=2735881 RepID=UPI001614DC46|nr:hypothetical protein [Arthrobacter sp. AZCC_0090]MBB6404214.1 hypothetical protein [Arthrobacter sp. AZCC_0090]